MNGDFGAEVDAALNARLSELSAAAEAARAAIDRSAAALPQTEDESSDGPPVPIEGIGDEYEVEADAEGIPLPEDNL